MYAVFHIRQPLVIAKRRGRSLAKAKFFVAKISFFGHFDKLKFGFFVAKRKKFTFRSLVKHNSKNAA